MDAALGWIGYIADWLAKFIPRWNILDTTEGAIKYVRGKKAVACGPGIHWHWPICTTWVVFPTARQTDRLESQTMESSDGKTFIVGATLTYRVEDLALLIPMVHSPMTTVVDIAMTAVHDICCDMTWAELQMAAQKGTIKTKLRNEAQKQLREYGIQVIKLQLNTLARARVLKVSQSVSNEEN